MAKDTLLSAGGLLLAVAAVLTTGAVLRGRVPTPATRTTDLVAEAPAPEASWTLQLLVACRRDTVDALVASAGPDPDLRVSPVTHQGRPCWRVCWGSFATREAAEAAAPPPALAGLGPPSPRPLAELR
jgi:hypothetical protein